MKLTDIIYDENYYNTIIKDYNYTNLSATPINFSLGNLPKEELQAKWLCHDGGDIFAKDFKNGKRCIIATGFGLSGVPHVGTLSQILKSIQLQRAGIPISMVLGDLDAYNNKNTPLNKTLELAEKYKEFIISLGFDTSNSILRSQFNDLDTLRTFYLIGRYMDDAMFNKAEEDLYGSYRKPDQENPDIKMFFRRKLSLGLMTADFINLHLREKYNHVLVMVGIDEHRFVRLAKEVLKRIKEDNNEDYFKNFNLVISGIYTPVIKGFNNFPKMSKSIKGSGITVDMEPEEIKDLIINGEGSYDSPENNVVYQMIANASLYTLDEIKEAYLACKHDPKKWLRIKMNYADQLINLCSKWKR